MYLSNYVYPESKGEAIMGVLFVLCILGGVFCLVYYGIITMYAGVGTAFAWFWICAAIGLFLVSLVIFYLMKNEIKLPSLIRHIVITIIVIGAGFGLLLEGTIIYHSQKEAKPGVEYLIVLGAQVRGDRITKSLKYRLDTAKDYLNSNLETKVIVSGGQGPGENLSEAEAMSRYLVEHGIDENRIIKEANSTNTVENIQFSKQLLPNENVTIAVVTNGFHVFRSVCIAKKQGLTEVQGLAAPSDQILTINYYVREAAGVMKDLLFGNIL
jgi:uncharacterized SAM-binding protein YcdF (DUF218 family)